ncbi:MAG: hypothetical protein M3355_08915 [Actinomycetota bacterium]|nr:hypothetical protein [Actinomycetota bacterium]
MEAREDEAWLLRNRFNPFPISGSLSLAGGVLSFTLDEDAAEATLGWLEDELDTEDLAERIEAGEKIVAFSLPLDEVEVSWPITGGPMMVIDGPTRKWVVSYDHPVGGAVLQTFNLMSGRGKARGWKKALAAFDAPGPEPNP